ncbi:CAAX protease [Clostridium acetobutylicum]|nr:CAAX protease [Clostridium acetobutylicum]
MDFKLFKDIKTRYLFIAMTAVTIVSGILLAFINVLFNISLTDDVNELYALVVTVIWFIMALIFIKVNKIKISDFFGKFPKKSFIVEVPFTWIITYLGAMGAILIMFYVIATLDPHILKSVQSNVESRPTILSSSFFVVISFLGTVIAAPVAEEFIFRGILFRRLYSKYGLIAGVFLSSLIFFVLHLTLNPIIFFLALGLAMLSYKYKSLIPSIFLHALNNLITFLQNSARTTASDSSASMTVDNSMLIIGIIFFILYLIFLVVSLKKCSKLKPALE